jgi:polysaccharide export outer membrane protein
MLARQQSLAVLFIGVAFAQTRSASVTEPPAPNLPLDKIGANDLISVFVYDAPEFTRAVRVGADGRIRLPVLRRWIQAEGLFPSELEAGVAEGLRAERLLKDPVVTVTIAEYQSRPVSISGAVKNPVTFQALGNLSLLEAITRAGGLAPEAGPEILVIKQHAGAKGEPVSFTQHIPVKALLGAGDPDLNIRLLGGEEIRVPESGKIYVVGNVKRPGAFPVEDASETTVLKMLALAEGLAPFAGKQAYIYRRDSSTGSKREIPVELQKILRRQAPDALLAPNDILYVPDNSNRRATVAALDRIITFGAATASGVLVYSSIR